MKKNVIILIITVLSLNLWTCNNEEIITDSGAKLEFSVDTIVFDTIFSTIGSATKHLKVYNRHDQKIEISRVRLAKETQNFRLNINGMPVNSAQEIEIAANDSLYIFVEITIDPNQQNMPLLVQDSIVFETNGNMQDIDLVAWGQDAHFIDDEVIPTQTWDNEKPFLIYNSMLVPANNTLTIRAGTQLHFHRYSRLYVEGTLIVEGTTDEPVVFQGDRLEYPYWDVPGQWTGIYLMNGSKHNNIDNAVIKNAIIGIQADTLADVNVPTLTLSNTRIEHCSYAGIYAQGSTIKGYNVLVDDCAELLLALTLGGNYEFYNSTFGNFWRHTIRQGASVVLNNYYIDVNENVQLRALENAYFGNCIVYGNNKNEIAFNFHESTTSNFKFENCILRLDPEEDVSNTEQYLNCIINPTFRFKAPYEPEYDYTPDTLSVAKDAAMMEIINANFEKLHTDLYGNSRLSDDGADIGAVERYTSRLLRLARSLQKP